jgi:malto-oligosyltrehalose trehalohydrolase
MKRFVETAQSHGIMVLLDIVLNHFSPEGSDLERIAPRFFDPEVSSPWGTGIAFHEPAVRRFMTDLVMGWLTEYRLDGLRFDAIHEIRDPHSDPEFLVELARMIRRTDFGRPIHLVAEDPRNDPWLIRDGLFTALWDDDFHHALHTLFTDEAADYLSDFAEDPTGKLTRLLAQGFAWEAEEAPAPKEGVPVYDLPWTAFVVHKQNHDQTGNRPGGARLLTLVEDPRAVEVAHALQLTSPFVPMLWMGEEEGERGPFHYFCDVSEELARKIDDGRRSSSAGCSATRRASRLPTTPPPWRPRAPSPTAGAGTPTTGASSRAASSRCGTSASCRFSARAARVRRPSRAGAISPFPPPGPSATASSSPTRTSAPPRTSPPRSPSPMTSRSATSPRTPTPSPSS